MAPKITSVPPPFHWNGGTERRSVPFHGILRTSVPFRSMAPKITSVPFRSNYSSSGVKKRKQKRPLPTTTALRKNTGKTLLYRTRTFREKKPTRTRQKSPPEKEGGAILRLWTHLDGLPTERRHNVLCREKHNKRLYKRSKSLSRALSPRRRSDEVEHT